MPIFSPKYSRMWSSGWYLYQQPQRAQYLCRTWRGFSLDGDVGTVGSLKGPCNTSSNSLEKVGGGQP